MKIYTKVKERYRNFNRPSKAIVHTLAAVGMGLIAHSTGTDCLEELVNNQTTRAVIDGSFSVSTSCISLFNLGMALYYTFTR